MNLLKRVLFVTALAASWIAIPSVAQAEDIDMSHVSADQLEQTCKAEGGNYVESSDESFYGCKTDCPGGSCAVICDKETCFGVVPGKRTTNRNPTAHLDTLKGISPSKEIGAKPDNDDDDAPWGLAGLLGLFGLAGLGLRKRS